MLFSVIIPVYNREKIVRRTLDTVLAQTHRPLQLVLVDNASTDGTLGVLNDFARLNRSQQFQVVVAQEHHRTASAARNRGLEHATGEWLMFFDSDDEMLPTLVEDYESVVVRNKGLLDVISTTSQLVFPDGESYAAPFFTRDMLANHILHGQLATQRYAVRREFFLSTSGWDVGLLQWDDWELGARLLLAQPRIAFMRGAPRVVINHSRKDSITGTEFHTRAGQWEHVIDVIEHEVRGSALRAKERYICLLDYRRLVLAAQYEREGYPELSRPLAAQAYKSLSSSYGNSRRWRWWVEPVTRRLYARIVAGKRGSARIARRLF